MHEFSLPSVPKTLLVEDDPVFRGIVADLLTERFPEMVITQLSDADRAFTSVCLSNPDLVFMDIQLPGENGLELTRRIKTLASNIVIVVLTGCDAPEYRQAAYQCGADGFILKGSAACKDEIVEWVGILKNKLSGPDPA